LPWEKLFFHRRFSVPLTREEAGGYATPLELVRLGPSASNKQPWRIVKDGNVWHFYLQRTKGYGGGLISNLLKGADLQRIDMGIAMSHFELAARELGLSGKWTTREAAIEKPDVLTEYTVSWVC
jgi:nitroreductase